MSEVREKVLEVGANAHLTKPINPDELVSTITRLVN
jgi:CheY-like chemotaxis protein